MNATEACHGRGFYRSSDRAVLGGVCAGIADYFGFNLRVLRLLAVIAFIFAMPVTIVAYMAAVFLIPARPGSGRASCGRSQRKKPTRRERRQARKEARHQAEAEPNEAAMEVKDKCQSLDKRLADLERVITSSKYQLDREIRNL